MLEVIQVGRNEVPRIVADCGHRFFTVRFVKRTTGEERTMNCRRMVRKHLRGGESAYNFDERKLVSVFDVQRGGYRCFPIDGVRELRAHGKRYEVRS